MKVHLHERFDVKMTMDIWMGREMAFSGWIWGHLQEEHMEPIAPPGWEFCIRRDWDTTMMT
jgi:hypothetical protein